MLLERLRLQVLYMDKQSEVWGSSSDFRLHYVSVSYSFFLNSRLSMMSARAGILDAVSLGKQLCL